MLNLYLISQNANGGYDTYDAAVVCAASEDEARLIHPDGYSTVPDNEDRRDRQYGTWTGAQNVQVKLIGMALNDAERGVVLASFNAG